MDHMVITKGFAIITDEIIQLFIVFDVEFIKNLHIIYVCETKKKRDGLNESRRQYILICKYHTNTSVVSSQTVKETTGIIQLCYGINAVS